MGGGTVPSVRGRTIGGVPDTIWSSVELHITSVEEPLASPEATAAAVDVLKAMEAMGLLGDEEIEVLSLDVVRSAARRAAHAGVGESAAASLQSSLDASGVAAALRELHLALEGSPIPGFEWPAMVDLFGPERLAELVGVSVASLRRYASGERITPDIVAGRLHLVARIVADLSGAYSEVGVRRWFLRSRSQLGGRSPGEVLSGDWDPDGEEARAVLELARSLTASPAT